MPQLDEWAETRMDPEQEICEAYRRKYEASRPGRALRAVDRLFSEAEPDWAP